MYYNVLHREKLRQWWISETPTTGLGRFQRAAYRASTIGGCESVVRNRLFA